MIVSWTFIIAVVWLAFLSHPRAFSAAATIQSTAPGGPALTAQSPWPAGMGVWKYGSDADSRAWYKTAGIAWYQAWSGRYTGLDHPYIYEIKTGNWSTAEITSWLAVREPNRFGVNIDCEVPRTAATVGVAQRARALGLKVFTGPCPWDVQGQGYFSAFDGIMTFYNVTGPTRFPADVFYFKALSYYYGKPMCFGVQPVDSDGNPVDAAALAQAETYASCFEGRIAWGTDRLVDSTASGAAAVTAALASIVPDVPRTIVTVRFQKSWRLDMALCRCVAYQGCLPQASLTAGVTWANLVVPKDYMSNLTKFYDGRCTKATLEKEERGMTWKK
jgi:hypothetical protein